MRPTVCLSADAAGYPEGGGHFWVFLNWALGLRALGCDVIWLEPVGSRVDRAAELVARLKGQLEPYGLDDRVALCRRSGDPMPDIAGALTLDDASDCDLLLNFRYDAVPEQVARFRRSALIDIDPGLLQTWLRAGLIDIAPHDLYFTIGETVGHADSVIPDCGLQWHYTPPCVALDWWPISGAEPDAPFTTVSHWAMDEWIEDGDDLYRNDKRSGFLPFLNLPQLTSSSLELATDFGNDADEGELLRSQGWRVREAVEVSATPWEYQKYIQRSRGEFSCVKPSCVRLQNAWISDRTLCYLASGKPAIVQHTGPSQFLPEDEGLLRFRTCEEASRYLELVASDYDHHCRLARSLAEEHFDAPTVACRVLERALS